MNNILIIPKDKACFINDCLYPDWEGGLERGKHVFDEDGFCKVCGMTIEQASRGEIKMPDKQKSK